MTTEQVHGIMERWGFPVLVALASGWVLRNDILLPMLDDHRVTLRDLRETQKVIAEAVTEQTRLLYALQDHIESQQRAAQEPPK